MTHSTWWSRDSSFSLWPTDSAMRPPMPMSSSSNTSVGMRSDSARITFSASMTREISPPDAMLASGFSSSPALGDIRNSIRSIPWASTL